MYGASVAAYDADTGDELWTRGETNLPVSVFAGPREPLARTAPDTLPFLVVGSPARTVATQQWCATGWAQSVAPTSAALGVEQDRLIVEVDSPRRRTRARP